MYSLLITLCAGRGVRCCAAYRALPAVLQGLACGRGSRLHGVSNWHCNDDQVGWSVRCAIYLRCALWYRTLCTVHRSAVNCGNSDGALLRCPHPVVACS